MSAAPATDVLVLGSGVAGLSVAIRAARAGLAVTVLTKGELASSATRYAQGGVAAALEEDVDSPALHLSDTISAGVGLCDVDAARILVTEGPDRVRDLIGLGAEFDRGAGQDLAYGREGGHSVARIVHAGGDATGAEIERALVDAVRHTASTVQERWFALELRIVDGACVGVRALDPHGETHDLTARHTVLATGGAGQCFAVTTNPSLSTGDGVAMARRAGVAIADVEFMQFHPTALFSPRMPRPLLSEALRGHGALIRDRYGDRFVDELRPRDVVARAITAKLIEQDTDHVWLDATGLEHFDERFPTIAADLYAAGLDPARDWLPIAPAAHYHCGGVLTDLNGATALPGLWAAGEVANVGVHGANRLASNSLLEGMVYGPRVIEAIGQGVYGAEPSGAMRAALGPGPLDDSDVIGGRRITRPRPTREPPAVGDVAMLRSLLQRTMTRCAGVLRSAASLDEARRAADAVGAQAVAEPPSPGRAELLNLVEVAWAVLAGASAREESRGCHTREDHPETLDAFQVRLVQ